MTHLSERGIGTEEHQRIQHFHTPETFSNEFIAGRPLIVEVNAGNSPIGLSLAERVTTSVVISHDIANPSRNGIRKMSQRLDSKRIPDNFYYLTGSLEDLDMSQLSALLSMFPSNLPETLGWLPGVIKRALEALSDAYIGIVTENSSGKGIYGLNRNLSHALSAQGMVTQVSEHGMDQIAGMFGLTDFGKSLRGFAQTASLIEINADRRAEFIKS